MDCKVKNSLRNWAIIGTKQLKTAKHPSQNVQMWGNNNSNSVVVFPQTGQSFGALMTEEPLPDYLKLGYNKQKSEICSQARTTRALKVTKQILKSNW